MVYDASKCTLKLGRFSKLSSLQPLYIVLDNCCIYAYFLSQKNFENIVLYQFKNHRQWLHIKIKSPISYFGLLQNTNSNIFHKFFKLASTTKVKNRLLTQFLLVAERISMVLF